MAARNAITILFLLLFIGSIICWIFFAPHLPFFENIWRSFGKPETGERAIGLVIMGFIIFVLSARLLKSGPI